MRKHTRPVKPLDLGLIGKEHLAAKFETAGVHSKTFKNIRNYQARPMASRTWARATSAGAPTARTNAASSPAWSGRPRSRTHSARWVPPARAWKAFWPSSARAATSRSRERTLWRRAMALGEEINDGTPRSGLAFGINHSELLPRGEAQPHSRGAPCGLSA